MKQDQPLGELELGDERLYPCWFCERMNPAPGGCCEAPPWRPEGYVKKLIALNNELAAERKAREKKLGTEFAWNY